MIGQHCLHHCEPQEMAVVSLTSNNFPELIISWVYIYGLFQAFPNATVDKFVINCTTGVSHCVSFVSNYVIVVPSDLCHPLLLFPGHC